MSLAERLKIPESNLVEWVENKVTMEREALEKEKDRERQFQKEEKERQALEKDKERQMLERESERKEREIARQREERVFERDLKRMEYELQLKKIEKEKEQSESKQSMGFNNIKIPMFDSEKDDLDLYLERFERQCSCLNIDRTKWPTLLLNLLSGQALSVLLSLASDDAKNYDRVKDALLIRFNCSMYSFKKKFLTAKPLSDENFDTFLNRTNRYFQRWIDLAGAKDFESLSYLFLSEQLFEACNSELVTYIKDRSPRNISELKEAAHAYTSSRPEKEIGKKEFQYTGLAANTNYENSRISRGRSETRPQIDRRTSRSFSRPSHKEKSQRSKSAGGRDPIRCFNCNKTGHVARQCRSKVNESMQQDRRCFVCGESGHFKNRCPHLKGERKSWHAAANAATIDYVPVENQPQCAIGINDYNRNGTLSFHEASLNGRKCKLLLDSGCDTVGVRQCLISPDSLTGRCVNVRTFLGGLEKVQTAIIDLDSPFFVGKVEACVLPNPVADVILGRIKGLNIDFNARSPALSACPAVTRAQSKNAAGNDNPGVEVEGVQTSASDTILLTNNIKLQQESDMSLKPWFSRVGADPIRGVCMFLIDGILHRSYQSDTINTVTLVVPESLRVQVMSLAHESPLSGHAGYKKTLANIQSQFSWPGITRDVKDYVKSCHICQVKAPVGRDRPAPLQSMPPIAEPFQRVVIDIVGPLPCTDAKNIYILTLVDMATRWAEAIPMRSITADRVAEALFSVFTRLGFPIEIQSDRGPQFRSDLFAEFTKLTGMRHLFSSPFHPQTNGVVERFHSTLKSMLRKLSAHSPSEWDRFLPAALFAYRQQPHSSLGFSPFFLLFGRAPRGPMAMLRDSLLNKEVSCDMSLTYHFIVDLHKKIKDSCRLAQQSLQEVAVESKQRHDFKSHLKTFEPNDKVLVLLPDNSSKLVLSLKGPFDIVKKVNRVVYLVNVNGKLNPYHVNLLRKYFTRDETVTESTQLTDDPTANVCFSNQLYSASDENIFNTVSICSAIVTEEEGLEIGCQVETVSVKEQTQQVTIGDSLSPVQREEVLSLITEFSDVITPLPGHTQTVEHVIRLKSDEIIRVKPYPLPFASEQFVRDEVKTLLDLGVIEHSTSPYCSPLVLVKKKDSSLRLCIDFRKLNAITVFDSTNIPLPEELFSKLYASTIFTSCDLSKAYWQIPVHPDSRPLTAFQTPLGLMQWKRMPFGLVTAPATFCRLMRLVLSDVKNVLNYFDDTLVHTSSWYQHKQSLRKLLETLRKHSLTVNPKKLSIGQSSIEFLGHTVSGGEMAPIRTQITKVLDLKIPKTKKQLRSLLGLVSYYRAFIPNFSMITKPMTDLLRKGSPDKIRWNSDCQSAFEKLLKSLSSDPILIIPDLEAQFIVRTDASDYGIGAVLLQQRDGVLKPCRYASRKLLPRESRYSTIERECLAIVFALSHFYKYLAMRQFVIQTDHKPLLFLKTRQAKNARLMRWALALQEYTFSIQAIPGKENCHADVLSRLC